VTGERHSVWFPLALLGFLLLGLGASAMRSTYGWFAYGPNSRANFGFVSGGQLLTPDNAIVAVKVTASPSWLTPWQPVIAIAFLATVAWYTIRARRAGTPFPARRVLGVVVAGLVVLLFGILVAATVRTSGGPWLATAVGLPLVSVGVCAGVWAYFQPGRKVAFVVCAVCLPLAAYALAAAGNPSLVGPVTAALGLSVLAWLTRGVLLGVIVVVFLLAALAFRVQPLALLVPGAVLLAGAIAVLVAARRAPAPGT
jgi:hypothetical protein